MIIDFHVHMFPDHLAPKTIPLLAQRSGLSAYSDGTVSMTQEIMQKAGVTRLVHLSIATNPRQMPKVNDFAIACNRQEGIVSFGSVHPEAADYEYELDRLQEAGIRGIKLHPDYQDFMIDAPAMQSLYEAILKRGFILVFHTGLDYGFPDKIHATTEGIVNTLSLFSGEKVVLAHMGGFQMYEKTLGHIIGRDVYLDTSFSTAYADAEVLYNMLTGHNPDKLLFASDFPWGSVEREIKAIRAMNLPERLKEKIFYQNAEELLAL